jgi:NADH:ubiquinone oxidoreductase subunit K
MKTNNLLLLISLALFCVGVVLVISKKNAIAVLMGIELIFNAAHVNFVTFAQADNNIAGQMFTIFSIIIAACETAVGLALVLQIYKVFKTNDMNELK